MGALPARSAATAGCLLRVGCQAVKIPHVSCKLLRLTGWRPRIKQVGDDARQRFITVFKPFPGRLFACQTALDQLVFG